MLAWRKTFPRVKAVGALRQAILDSGMKGVQFVAAAAGNDGPASPITRRTLTGPPYGARRGGPVRGPPRGDAGGAAAAA